LSRLAAAHLHTSLILCEDAAALEELLIELGDLTRYQLHRVGHRAAALPAAQLPHLLDALRAKNLSPRILGSLPTAHEHNAEDLP
jgi:hypothetical protein